MLQENTSREMRFITMKKFRLNVTVVCNLVSFYVLYVYIVWLYVISWQMSKQRHCKHGLQTIPVSQDTCQFLSNICLSKVASGMIGAGSATVAVWTGQTSFSVLSCVLCIYEHFPVRLASWMCSQRSKSKHRLRISTSIYYIRLHCKTDHIMCI